MPIAVKICGIKDEMSLNAAVGGGAGFVGFVFYPPSPRSITVDVAEKLARLNPFSTKRVGLFVDPTDAELVAVRDRNIIDIIQLHGNETSKRIMEIRSLMGLPIMKAIHIAGEDDLGRVDDYNGVVDLLLFDAKTGGALPGGSGKSFDWGLLKGRKFTCPWMLAGGINSGNIQEAVAATGALIGDVSSGVEDSPGVKNSGKIRELLEMAARI